MSESSCSSDKVGRDIVEVRSDEVGSAEVESDSRKSYQVDVRSEKSGSEADAKFDDKENRKS